MSFSDQILRIKQSLKPTTTTITLPSGEKFIQTNSILYKLEPTEFGFVVDTTLDAKPAQITEYVFLGSQDATDLEPLTAFQIQYVLSLGIEAPVQYPHITYKHVKCLDFPETNLKDTFLQCFEFIKDAVHERSNILVHCNAGVSRSASVVIAYLITEKKLSFDDAYALVKTKRRCIRPNDGFLEQLRKF